MKLINKVAIVTGAGRGIGKAIAVEFARQGAKLAIVARSVHEIQDTASEIRSIGGEVIEKTADVSNPEEIEDLVQKTINEFDKLDVLVNNAGILGPVGPLANNDRDSWIHTINVNLVGTYLCCRGVLPHMIEQNGGSIINLSGAGSPLPYPMFSAYAASKIGVLGLTQTLAEEVREYSIKVNAIAPGLVNTSLQDEIIRAGGSAGQKALLRAKEAKEKGGVPLSRVAELATFLASDESVGLTGRLLSAAWDNWQNLRNNETEIEKLMSSELYTLRRIDGVFFAPVKGD